MDSRIENSQPTQRTYTAPLEHQDAVTGEPAPKQEPGAPALEGDSGVEAGPGKMPARADVEGVELPKKRSAKDNIANVLETRTVAEGGVEAGVQHTEKAIKRLKRETADAKKLKGTLGKARNARKEVKDTKESIRAMRKQLKKLETRKQSLEKLVEGDQAWVTNPEGKLKQKLGVSKPHGEHAAGRTAEEGEHLLHTGEELVKVEKEASTLRKVTRVAKTVAEDTPILDGAMAVWDIADAVNEKDPEVKREKEGNAALSTIAVGATVLTGPIGGGIVAGVQLVDDFTGHHVANALGYVVDAVTGGEDYTPPRDRPLNPIDNTRVARRLPLERKVRVRGNAPTFTTKQPIVFRPAPAARDATCVAPRRLVQRRPAQPSFNFTNQPFVFRPAPMARDATYVAPRH